MDLASELNNVALILRVVFLMLYVGVYLAYSLNRKDIVSLSPAHQAMISAEMIPNVARLGLIYFLVSGAAGIPLFVVVFGRIGHFTVPFVLEGLLTSAMFFTSIYGYYLTRGRAKPSVSTVASPVDPKFKWVTVNSEREFAKQESKFWMLCVSSVVLGIMIIGVGLVISYP